MSNDVNRRAFLLGAAPAGISAAMLAEAAFAPALWGQYASAPAAAPAITDKTVFLAGDAPPVSQKDFLATLNAAAARHNGRPDNYLKGGAVTELEQTVATMLGKEDCCFLPTGTLANNLAVRLLCGEHKHVIAQTDSHLYADESDAPSIMSGLTMQPIAAGKAAPTYEEFAAAIADAEGRAYPIKVGAISIESPVRRHDGEGVPFETIQRVCTLAKSKGIGMHWDGARAFMFLGTPGFDMKRTASQFDTVYLSLYKALRAPFGAVLAGPKATIEQARDLRHVFGGLIYHGWVAALPALESLQNLPDKWTRARANGEEVLAKLQAAGYEIHRVPNGSNIVAVQVPPAKLAGLPDKLKQADVVARVNKEGRMLFFINETLLRQSPAAVAAPFLA